MAVLYASHGRSSFSGPAAMLQKLHTSAGIPPIRTEDSKWWRKPSTWFACRKAESPSNAFSHNQGKQAENEESGRIFRRATPPWEHCDAALNRRSTLLAGLASLFVLNGANKADAADTLTENIPETFPLDPYIDEVEGFRVLKPLGWERVEKSGANVLFEDPFQRSNSIGVVINPVRIESLAEFGSPTEVADRLIQVERKKSSTKDVQLLDLSLRKVKGGFPLYTIEYFLDTTRGSKKILTAVTISKRKLYILNIAFSAGSTQAAPFDLNLSMHRVLDSFDLV